jgi:hypothetical protein
MWRSVAMVRRVTAGACGALALTEALAVTLCRADCMAAVWYHAHWEHHAAQQPQEAWEKLGNGAAIQIMESKSLVASRGVLFADAAV